MEQQTPAAAALPPSDTAALTPQPPPLAPPLPQGPSKTSSMNGGKAAAAEEEGAPRKLSAPTPEEMVAHYEAQGMEPREASLRVIRELQSVLYRAVAAGRGRKKKDRFVLDTGRKLDHVNTRLAVVEMKLDSKPGYPGMLAAGAAAGAALQGVAAAAPHVLGALGKVWETARSAATGGG